MQTITDLQKFLFPDDPTKQNGKWGPESQGALNAILKPLTPVLLTPTLTNEVPVDTRSEQAIATLHPKVQSLARQFVKLTQANGIKIEITSGTRTYAEQNALFNQGGVTRARGGQSNHNFGLAFDVTIDAEPDDKLQPVWESPLYKKLGALGESLGLSWGGRWKSIVDEPHFELRPHWAENLSEGQMMIELRRRHDNGIDYFV